MVAVLALIRRDEGEEEWLAVRRTDQLQTDGHAIGAEAARKEDRRHAREVASWDQAGVAGPLRRLREGAPSGRR